MKETPLYQLKTIRRYNNVATVTNETLAEHMYFTSLMILLAKPLFQFDDFVYSKLLEYSLMHDVPELWTGDIPHDLKQRSPGIKNLLDPIELEIFYETFNKDITEYSDIKSLFKVFDLLQVVQYCRYERLLGNENDEIKSIENHAQELAEGYFDEARSFFQSHVKFADLESITIDHNLRTYAKKEKI